MVWEDGVARPLLPDSIVHVSKMDRRERLSYVMDADSALTGTSWGGFALCLYQLKCCNEWCLAGDFRPDVNVGYIDGIQPLRIGNDPGIGAAVIGAAVQLGHSSMKAESAILPVAVSMAELPIAILPCCPGCA